MQPRPRSTLFAVALALWLPSTAVAGGFFAPLLGGEMGHPTTDDATAIQFNPAGLSLKRGTRVNLNGVFVYRLIDYDRPAAAIDHPLAAGDTMGGGTPTDALSANSGRATMRNILVAPFAALVTDLGVRNLALALGFAVPFGGQAHWDANNAYKGSLTYPGAVDGVQRWSTLDGIIRSSYFSLAGSYTIKKARLSLGAAVNLVFSEVSLIRARNANGSDDLVSGGAPIEGRSLLDVSGLTASLALGVIWQPADNWWIGLSYQSQPGFGRTTLTGQLTNRLGFSPVAKQDVELQQSLPDVLRLGFRYRPRPRWEVRLWGEYQRWSVFDKQCVLDRGVANRSCKLLPSGAVDTAGGGAGVILALPRNWKDGGSVHGGASFWALPNLELQLGLGYDANVVPASTLDPALPDHDKVLVAVGLRSELVRRKLMLAATYTQIINIDRTTLVRDPASAPAAPSLSPDNAGTYHQVLGALSLSLEYNFTGP